MSLLTYYITLPESSASLTNCELELLVNQKIFAALVYGFATISRAYAAYTQQRPYYPQYKAFRSSIRRSVVLLNEIQLATVTHISIMFPYKKRWAIWM